MAKKKKASSGGKGFSAKEFLIYHTEKIIFAVIATLSLLLVYFGFSSEKFPSSKKPEDLKKQAESTIATAVNTDHWEQMQEAEPERTTKVKYEIVAKETRGYVDPRNFSDAIYPNPDKQKTKRGDPEIVAPTKIVAKYFSGAIATLSAKDPFETLQDAKREEPKKPKNPGMGMGGYPGSGGSGFGGEGGEGGLAGSGSGMGPGGMGMGPGGMGMGAGSGGMGTQADLKRYLSPAYNRGFSFGMFTTPEVPPKPIAPADRTKKLVAKEFSMVAVTALAEHQLMEENYFKEFSESTDFMDGRDTPNYQGFEVQRVEITKDTKEIAENDWVTITDVSPESWKKFAYDKFIGTAKEVNRWDFVNSNLSMPIPPILLTEYRDFCSHPEVPSDLPEFVNDYEAPTGIGFNAGTMGGYGSGEGSGYGMGMGMGMGMGGGGAGYGSEGSGSGYPGGEGGMAGSGMGPGGMGMGAGGMGPGGMGPGGMGMGAGGMGPGGMGMGAGGMGGEGYGSEGSGSGYGAGGYGMGGGTAMGAPRRQPSSKYKLIRFFDTTVKPGASYRYRVRLIMYDPNFPEYEMISPKNINLKPDALARVQDLKTKELPDKENFNKRKSGRITDWSIPSEIVTAAPTATVFAKGAEKPSFIVGPDGEYFESTPLRSEVVLADRNRSIYFSIKDKDPVNRGHVFHIDNAKINKDGIEFVDPVNKVLKLTKPIDKKQPAIQLKLPSVQVTVVDILGGYPLKMNTSKDLLPAGTEVVSFDASTGQLIISREYEDYTDFGMIAAPDKPAIGPLGGGGGSAAAAGGMGPGMGAGGMGSGGMGSEGGGGGLSGR